jgi:hypothetical protein
MMRLEATIPAASRLKMKQAGERIVQSYVDSRKAERAAKCREKLRPDHYRLPTSEKLFGPALRSSALAEPLLISNAFHFDARQIQQSSYYRKPRRDHRGPTPIEP